MFVPYADDVSQPSAGRLEILDKRAVGFALHLPKLIVWSEEEFSSMTKVIDSMTPILRAEILRYGVVKETDASRISFNISLLYAFTLKVRAFLRVVFNRFGCKE